MDGVEDMPVLGRRRSRSNSWNYDEVWPLPPAHVVERGMNTPGEPRRSSLIQQEQIDAAIRDSARNASIAAGATASCPKAKNGLEALEQLTHRDGSGSSSASPNTSSRTSKDSSSTDLTNLTMPPLCPQTSLSIIDEGPSSETPDKSFFVFDESFKESANRKKSQNLSPHTRANSPGDEAVILQPTLAEVPFGPITEAESLILDDAHEGQETDDDFHSVRSHMTRVTTLGPGFVVYNMSMATPNMVLPTPEELRADHERKEKLKTAYMKMNSGKARSASEESALRAPLYFGIETAMRTEVVDPTPGGWLDKVRSVGYPFPRAKSVKKGKGKEKEDSLSTTKSNTSPRSVFARIDIFKSKETKAREQAEREAAKTAEEEASKLRDYEGDVYNRKVDIGSSIADSDSQAHRGPYKSPWVEPDTDGEDPDPVHPGTRISMGIDPGAGPSRVAEACTKKGVEAHLYSRCVSGGDPFHDNFATSSSGSAFQSLTSTDINYIRNSGGSTNKIVPLPQDNTEVVTAQGVPSILVGQFPAMSPALARNATLDERFNGRTAEKIGQNGHPLPRQLSQEEPQEYEGSSSSGSDKTDYVNDRGESVKVDKSAMDEAKRPRARKFMRPGMQSRASTVRDLDVRRASTVEISRSGDTHTRIVTQEARGSMDSSMDEGDRRLREAKLRELASRKRSMLGRKKSTASGRNKCEIPKSSEEGSPGRRRRLSAAIQGGFGGNSMRTDGRGGIESTQDDRKKERAGRWRNIIRKFTKGDENDAMAANPMAQMPTIRGGIATTNSADGDVLRQKTSWWKKHTEQDPDTGRIPMMKRAQEVIKRGNSNAIPQPKASRATTAQAAVPRAKAQAPTA